MKRGAAQLLGTEEARAKNRRVELVKKSWSTPISWRLLRVDEMKLLTATIAIAPLLCNCAWAADGDPCTSFKWDVSHELSLMKQVAREVAAAAKPGADVPQLQADTLYRIGLASQRDVTFAATPGKAATAEDARAGLVQFRTSKAGRYRVSLSTRHWIDVVDGAALIKAADFQGARDCQRPHKIVEFELPADRTLILQLSGVADSEVAVTVTATR